MSITQAQTDVSAGCTPDRALRPVSDALPKFPKLAPLLNYLGGLSTRADLSALARLLSTTHVSREDITTACMFGVKGYKRNCIARSEHFELLACCWRSGDRTPIHDHPGVSCAFRVVEGLGTETRFIETPSGLLCATESVQMPAGYVCAAEENDIHQVANMQEKGQDLITLHIYSPPIRQMHTFQWGECSTSEADNIYETPC
jgi:cysteine dioxygenase